MIREAIEYIVSLKGDDIVTTKDGIEYIRNDYGHTNLPPEPLCKMVFTNTLNSIYDFISSHVIEKSFVFVQTEKKIVITSDIFGELRQREVYLEAESPVKPFPFGKWFDQESFIINLFTGFVQDENRDRLLLLVSGINDSKETELTDNGVSQQVTVKTGLTTVKRDGIVNPIVLRPYRTFIEVEQPASPFVFRIKKESTGVNMTLLEADGGLWKTVAMKSIAAFLQEEMKKFGLNNLVHIIV